MKNKNIYIVLTLFSLFFISCSSNRLIRDKAQGAYKDNDYETAISYLQNENIDGELIDLNLDEAMLLFLDENYKDSSTLFNSTGYQMAKFTGEMTVGQMIQAGLLSEESIEYVGPAYEYALIDIMNAFNYMKLGDYDNARAMMRRSFNNNKSAFNELKAKLRQMNHQSEESFNSPMAQNAIRDMADEGLYYDFNSFVNSSLNKKETDYGLSPFIFFLGSALFANDYDIDLAKEWMANLEGFISPSLASTVINIPEGMGSINVVALSDTIVKREEAYDVFPMLIDDNGLRVNFKLTWPIVPESYNIVDNIKVRVFEQTIDKHGKVKKGELVAQDYCELIEDFDQGVRLDVASKADGAFARSLVRNITRKTATYIASIIAVENAKDLANQGGTMEFFAYLGAVTAMQVTMNALDATEHADIRQCVFFPSKATAAGFILEPGKYTVEISYLNAKGKEVKNEEINDVIVYEGSPSVIPSEYINTGNLRLTEVEDYYY